MKAVSLQRIGTGLCLGLSLLIVMLWLAWQLLVPANFAYPLAYQWMDIGQHVQKYGPQNRYKRDFARTTEQEQQRLFGEIVQAIQHGGEGLRKIFYTTEQGRRYTLLREAEAVHLQDVANLVTLFHRVAWGAIAVLLLTLAWMKRSQQPAPSPLQMLAGLGGLLLLCGAIMLVAGPTETFYWLHTRIFPADHEWFFYYQDSLMTTLMKAPDLFGFIAALWLSLAILLLIAGYLLTARWLRIRSTG